MPGANLIQQFKRTTPGRRLAAEPAVAAAWLRVRSLPHALSPRARARRSVVIERYLASTREPRLQLGSGPWPLEGWLNSDLVSGDVYIDITRPLPFPDRSLAYVFSEHVIEHVTDDAAMRLLGEVHRALRPGGVVRITTPDLRKIIALYEDRNPVVSRAEYARFLDGILVGRRHERGCQVLNSFMRAWGHRYIYDEEDLTARLREVGFTSIERHEPGESRRRLLRGIDRHGGSARPWENAAEAMSIEAVRPA